MADEHEDGVGGPGGEARVLLAGCRGGQAAEREAAYQRLGQLLYRVLWPHVAQDPRLVALAEDCVQLALVKVWRALESGRGPDDPDRFINWASRVAANTLVSELRKEDPATGQGRSKRVGLRHQVSLEAAAEPEEGPARELAAETEDLDAGPAKAELAALLAQIRDLPSLSAASRTVLLQGYLAEWDDEELAGHLGSTRANVHVIRSRDLTKLRQDPEFMTRLAALAGPPA